MKRPHLTFAMAAIAATLGFAQARAETMTYKADLKNASEAPPTTGDASGSVTATYDTTDKKLSWKGDIKGLSGTATAAHFHGPAEPGKNAPVMVPVTGAAAGSFEGSATLTDDQAKALTSGMMYFNIHTAAHPAGEVRGQVVKAP